MSHGRYRNNFIRFKKKKLGLGSIFVGFILLLVLLVAGVVLIAIINTLPSLADSSLGKSISNLLSTLWNVGLDFVRTLWKQVIANPLQSLTGGNN